MSTTTPLRSTRLSIYKSVPDENEITSAESNLKLFFPDIEVAVKSRDPISVLRDCLARSKFMSGIDISGALIR